MAVAHGRPMLIDAENADVEMISAQDFIEDDAGTTAETEPYTVHVQFFLEYVKLCQIMGQVLANHYRVGSRDRRRNTVDLAKTDAVLADWLRNCSQHVLWDGKKHHFLSALLHLNYL